MKKSRSTCVLEVESGPSGGEYGDSLLRLFQEFMLTTPIIFFWKLVTELWLPIERISSWLSAVKSSLISRITKLRLYK